MNPLDLFGLIGDAAGSSIGEITEGVFESIMRGIWDAALFILREAFKLADTFSVFTVSTTEGPVGVLWPVMLWIGGVLALGLFFWQITSTMLRGGRGFTRLVGGPFQYGVALAVTVGMVGIFLAGADALTTAILDYSLHARNFNDALSLTGFTDAASDGVKAVVLALAGLVGVFPAALGYIVEMLFREAAIYVLVATIPLTAAGLLANVTASWFWRTVRWLLAAIAMKPVLALTLVLGIAIAGGAQGLSGLLAGIGVLLISLCVPLVLFKLFAFVDPNTDAGAAFRDQLSSAGLDSYGTNSIAGKAGHTASGGMTGGSDEDSADDQEQANTDRFDQAAVASSSDDEPEDDGADGADGGSSGSSEDSGPPQGSGASAGPADDDGAPIPPVSSSDDPAGPAHDGDGGSRDGNGDDDPPPNPPDDGGSPPTPPAPPSGPSSGGGNTDPSDVEAEDAAVVA